MNTWRRRVLLGAMAGLASACASVAEKPEFVPGWYAKSAALPAADLPSPDDGGPITGLIAIGPVTHRRAFDDANIGWGYQRYQIAYFKWLEERPPAVSYADFSSRYSGWTQVVPFKASILKLKLDALVPGDLPANVVTEPATPNLVAARTNADGVLEVVALLCAWTGSEAEFETCKADYPTGLFDQQTGWEIAMTRTAIKKNGERIDTSSYRGIPIN